MKSTRIFVFIITFMTLVSLPQAGHALSCLSTSQYLESIVGSETTVVFQGTVTDTITEPTAVQEVVTITEAYQGFVPGRAFLSHQKDETWGFLCNTGPVGTDQSAVYIAEQTDSGYYLVNQTLAVDSELVDTLLTQLKDANIIGTINEFSTTDRQNQIRSTIADLLQQILQLLKEYTYWSTAS